MIKTLLAAAALATLPLAAPAAIIDSLPYNNGPDWTVIVFGGTSMASNGSQTTLSTAPGVGVWFGWGAWYSDTPGWTPGDSASGNHLGLSLSLSAGAADWSAYFYDNQHYAAWQFNPTHCSNNCYGVPAQQGVQYFYASASSPTTLLTGFVPLDLTQQHSFDLLLKNGHVSYAIDGQVIYDGSAYQSGSIGAPLLVIGDGSATTLSGEGSMTLYGTRMDTAPVASSLVPEPSAGLLLLAGLGLLSLRRARKS